jgi:hypothetical protein
MGLFKLKDFEWDLNPMSLGDWNIDGATIETAITGYYFNFTDLLGDSIRCNLSLTNQKIEYDGSPVVIKFQNSKIGLSGAEAIWDLDYSFVSTGDDPYNAFGGTETISVDVGSRVESIQYSDSFPAIQGPKGATQLQMTISRNTGDSYLGDMEIYSINANKE